jgi:hypothetical protein
MPRCSSFTELTKGFSPERRERIERLRQDMTLAERRKAFPLTRDTLAKSHNVWSRGARSRSRFCCLGQAGWRRA